MGSQFKADSFSFFFLSMEWRTIFSQDKGTTKNEDKVMRNKCAEEWINLPISRYWLAFPNIAVVKENAHLMLNLIILERLNLTIIQKTDQHSSMLDMLKFQLKLIRTGSYRKVNHKNLHFFYIIRQVNKKVTLELVQFYLSNCSDNRMH